MIASMFGDCYDYMETKLRPCHIVVAITEHAFDVAPKRILRLSKDRLQIFLVKYEYL